MYRDLTKGRIGSTLILFALPMIAGNLLQQFYNIADTLIVGQVLGRDALAAVGWADRSGGRRVGIECRCRWSPWH